MVVSAVSGVLAVKLFFDDDGSLRGVNILLLIPSRDHEGVPNDIRSKNFIGKYQENWDKCPSIFQLYSGTKKI